MIYYVNDTISISPCAPGVGNMPWGLDFLEMRPTRGYLRFKDVTLLAK